MKSIAQEHIGNIMEWDEIKRLALEKAKKLKDVVTGEEAMKANEQFYRDMLHTNPEQLEAQREAMRKQMSEVPEVYVSPETFKRLKDKMRK